MAGKLSASEARGVISHLLTDCAVCREITGPLTPFGRATDVVAAVNSSEQSTAAEHAASARLLKTLQRREQALTVERKEAPSRLAELASQDQPHRLLLVRNTARFSTWGVTEHLIEESYRHRFHDTKSSLDYAELGAEAADRLDVAAYGFGPVHDLRARAWAVKGNALRLSADLRGATRCLNAALKLLENGTGDPLEEARVCELFAVVRSNQRRIEQAVRLQERAMRLYRRAGHGDRLGKAMVDLASYNALAGDRQVAIELVTKALELIDADRDPHTALAGRHNLAVFLQEAGRRREALTVLSSARPLCEKLGDRSHVLRLRWLEGKLASEVGETKLAQDAYEEVYDGFVEYSPIDAALVSLDLALLYLENGRIAEVPAIMIAVETVFRSQEVHRDALAAWIVLREAVERKKLHDALIKHTARLLERERNRR
jgi:tetratricopeptide (TPR) repeat protein